MVSMMMWQVSPVALGPTMRLTDLILATKGACGRGASGRGVLVGKG